MAKNFPEIWLDRVIQNLVQGDAPDFLDGVNELDGNVIEVGDKNLLHIPTTSFSPDVLINNSTYPLAIQEYTDDEVVISLDKYQTKATKVTDDQVIGAAYDKIDATTKSHTNKINATKYRKAIHSLAPDKAKDSNIVLELKGDECTYDDLVALKEKCDDAGWPEDGRRLVLCSKHWNALLKDRKNFGDQLVNYKKGEVAPFIAGFEIKKYNFTPVYKTDKTKKAYGEVADTSDKSASVVFVLENTGKKTGLTKQYFSEAANNPETQANLLNYRHYFIATAVEDKWRGALI
ncbi:hypothetical protein GO491_03145 [Flavobacteriaceae bacterium Ap0902]|nr:hypothetical protein [Flavobacteriaceae bacterium Ap0902]